MYYLLNQTNQIIGADESLLELCGVTHIDELSSKIILGDTIFNLVSDDKLTINNDQTYSISKISLSSMLGDLTLINVNILDEYAKIENDVSQLLDMPTQFTLDDTLEDNLKSIADVDSDSELISIKSDEDTISITDDRQMEDLILEDDSVLIHPESDASILIDIVKISQEMGISHDDYNTFVEEYIDTALELEADLQSNEEEKRNVAISTLSQLTDLLHLPAIDTIIKELSTAPKNTQKKLIESFYTTLSRLTTQTPKVNTDLELFDLAMPIEESDIIVDKQAKTTPSKNTFGTISLDGIKPIHFDFRLEEAANDLSLPVELIKEFVHDFIDQGHIETIKMLEAYEKGDLDAIQKIGHLLKGASSNLRINELSDTLYEIQFCEDPTKLEAYIKAYWGHFLSFEIQINALAK